MALPSFSSVLVFSLIGQVDFPEPIFISAFPVSSDATLKDGTVEIEARVDGRDFAELTARSAAKYLSPGRFVVTVSVYPRSRDKPKKAHVDCTFLVDCNEPAVRAAAEAAATDLAASKGIPALTSWVARYIGKKTSTRGFDTASVVAARREGDCTEHAVLLAALLRSRKIAARVVLGLVLVDAPSKEARAMGHAWVEWYDGKQWLLADAALSPEEIAKYVGSEAIRVRYLPVRIIQREDAGFRAGLLGGLDVTEISRVVIPVPKTDRDQAGPRGQLPAP